MTGRRRILVADEHPLTRSGLRHALEAEVGLELAGEVADADELFARLETGPSPDVLVLDLQVPGSPGLELVRRIHDGYPHVGVLVLTSLPEEAFLTRAIRAGASGYLEKDCETSVVVEAIRAIAEGATYVSERGSRVLAEAMRPGQEGADHSVLSNREFEVLRRLGGGSTVTEIAAELDLSPKTVSTYRSRLLEKMGFSGNRDIVQYAITHGLAE